MNLRLETDGAIGVRLDFSGNAGAISERFSVPFTIKLAAAGGRFECYMSTAVFGMAAFQDSSKGISKYHTLVVRKIRYKCAILVLFIQYQIPKFCLCQLRRDMPY